jgi:hypothetical protein
MHIRELLARTPAGVRPAPLTHTRPHRHFRPRQSRRGRLRTLATLSALALGLAGLLGAVNPLAAAASPSGAHASAHRQRAILAHSSRLFGGPAKLFHGHGHGNWWSHGRWSPPSPGGSVKTIASGLNQPKKLTVAPDGSLIVALSGDGVAPASCTEGTQPSCLDSSGAIDRVTPWGQVTTLLGGLPSVAGGEGEATGPSEARFLYGHLEVLFQNTNINPTTGDESYGPAAGFLGDLVGFPPFGGPGIVQASFGPFEAQNNPDGGAGTAVKLGVESAIDSDPYSFVPYHGGIVVADAAGNDLLFVSPTGAISVLAVFPTIPEIAAPGTLGPEQTSPIEFEAQAVPTSVAVGPEGALYVGELGGVPFNVGTSSVYRVVPGQAPTVYARGFTAIGDIAFDRSGRLLVLEIDQKGIFDPALSKHELPAPGAIIGVHRNGTQTLLASTGLEFPTGMAVAPDGSVYVSNYGTLPATGGQDGLSGEVARVQLPWSWISSPW